MNKRIELSLRAAIKEYGNDRDLSRETGVQHSSISRFRTGERSLRFDTAEQLLEWFGFEFHIHMPE